MTILIPKGTTIYPLSDDTEAETLHDICSGATMFAFRILSIGYKGDRGGRIEVGQEGQFSLSDDTGDEGIMCLLQLETVGDA